jgi:hypothetical protein
MTCLNGSQETFHLGFLPMVKHIAVWQDGPARISGKIVVKTAGLKFDSRPFSEREIQK